MIFAVQTAPPRDPAPLLEKLRAQAGGMLGHGASVHVVRDDAGRGQLQTMLRVLMLGPQHGSPVTLIEDDVLICEGFVPYVTGMLPLPFKGLPHVVQWFAHGEIPVWAPRWFRQKGDRYYFNQAVTFSVEACRAILESDLTRDWAEPHGGDVLIQKVLASKGWRFATHVPGLVQHDQQTSLVGNNARVRPGDWRMSKVFVGEDYDARDLL